MAEKLDRKQLKRPDEFQVVAGKAMEWIAAHQREAVFAVVALAVAALAAWGFTAWQASREAKAGGELAEALEIESRPVAGEGPSQPGQQTFASADERTKAALAALEKVRADHGGTAAAHTALAQIGFLKLRGGDAAGAQKDLQEFLGKTGTDHPLRIFALESLGYAFEAQGKFDDARAAFDKLREVGLPARAEYQAARLSLVQGKPDAKQQLERVAKEYPKEEDVVREANERVELASLPPVTASSVTAPAEKAEKPAPVKALKKTVTVPAQKPQAKKSK